MYKRQVVGQAGGRDALRAGNEALGAGDGLQAQRVAHGLRLDEVQVLQVARHVDALAGEHGGEGGGQHEHVLVEAQRDIGHGGSFLRFLHDTETTRRAQRMSGKPVPSTEGAETAARQPARRRARERLPRVRERRPCSPGLQFTDRARPLHKTNTPAP